MAGPFQPKFVDLVRNYTSTTGTGSFNLGPAVNGYTGFAAALQPDDSFYYSAIGIDKPAEREVGRGTLATDGTISRDPITGPKTNFTPGTKSIALIAAAEWFTNVQSGAGGGSGPSAVGSRSELAELAATTLPAILDEAGREGLFVFDGSNLSAKVAADPFQGVHVAPASDATGASGAWVRKFSGPIDASWFGFAAGAAQNAERVESAVELGALIGVPDIRLPAGNIDVDRDIFVRRSVLIAGRGQSGAAPGTTLRFPAGCSGIRISWDNGGGSSVDPYDAKLKDLRVYQPTRSASTATGNYNAATRTFSITGGTNDYANGQIVWIEGCGPSYVLQGRSGATTSGSSVVAITSANGNPGVHIGQHIDIAGAGLPAGTIVTAWNSTTITLSNSPTASVSGAAITVTYPLVAHVVSGGGSANLVLDQVYQHYSKSGVAIRHGDAGLTSERPCQIENVDSLNFPIAAYMGGDLTNVPPDGTNTSALRYCRLSSDLASLVFNGQDANASTVLACDFSFSTRYGVLDLSLIGNHYFGCHFAFNVGISCPLPSNLSAMFGCYFEQGTSYLGSGNGTTAFGCMGLENGSGWGTMTRTGGGFSMPTLIVHGSNGGLTAAQVLATDGMLQLGNYGARFEGNANSVIAGGSGNAITLWRAGGYAYVQALQLTPTFGHGAMRIVGSQVEVQPDGTTALTISTGGLDMAAGKTVKANGTTVIDGSGNIAAARISGLAPIATSGSGADLAAASVSYAKIQNVAASRLLGNPTGSVAAPAEIGLAGGLTLSGTNLGLGAITPTSIAATGVMTSSGGGIGYAVGAGGAVTQTTSKSTAVTLHKQSGQITMHGAALANAAIVEFTVTNNQVVATDTINLNLTSGAAASTAYRYWVSAVAAGSFKIAVENRSGGSLSEVLVLTFALLKAVTA